MAIYQYHVTIVPGNSILRHWNNVKMQVHGNPVFREGDLIDVNWWEKEETGFLSVVERISEFADITKWTESSETLKVFGDTETNDVTVVKGETGLLEEISFRLDLRNLDHNFISCILKLTADLDCLLLDRQGNVFPPTLELLSANARASDAYRFVADPVDFLDRLREKGSDID